MFTYKSIKEKSVGGLVLNDWDKLQFIRLRKVISESKRIWFNFKCVRHWEWKKWQKWRMLLIFMTVCYTFFTFFGGEGAEKTCFMFFKAIQNFVDTSGVNYLWRGDQWRGDEASRKSSRRATRDAANHLISDEQRSRRRWFQLGRKVDRSGRRTGARAAGRARCGQRMRAEVYLIGSTSSSLVACTGSHWWCWRRSSDAAAAAAHWNLHPSVSMWLN